MARQTNIIPFDDARERSRRLASSSSSGSRRARRYTDEELDRAYETATNARERRRSAASSERRTPDRRSSASSRSREEAAARRGGASRQGAMSRQSSTSRQSASASKSASARQGSASRKGTSAGKDAAAREQRQRARTKARADRMFDRQFGNEQAGSDAKAEAAPRAALYEGRMGATHRKSARMQRASTASSVSAKVNPVGWLSSISIAPRTLYAATAVLCVLLVGVFLYTPAQQYYQAQRDRDRLAVEYALVQERNDAIDAQNDELASDSGMEDAVRKKYGYVKNGEQAVIVTGLSDSATDSSRGSDQIEPTVLASSVKAPEYWYTPLLDTFFGVE